MTTAPGPPVILPAIFASTISPSLAELGRSDFLTCTSGEATKTPTKYMKSGINDAQIKMELARRKPEKKIVVNPAKSRLDSFEVKFKKNHLVR